MPDRVDPELAASMVLENETHGARVGDCVRDGYDYYGDHGWQYGKVEEVRPNGDVLVLFPGGLRVNLNEGRYRVHPRALA